MGEKLRRRKRREYLKALTLDKLLDERYHDKKHEKFEQMKEKEIDEQRDKQRDEQIKKQESKKKREEDERTRKYKDIDVHDNERTSSFMYDADNEVEPTPAELVRENEERERAINLTRRLR